MSLGAVWGARPACAITHSVMRVPSCVFHHVCVPSCVCSVMCVCNTHPRRAFSVPGVPMQTCSRDPWT